MTRVTKAYRNDPSFRLAVKVFIAVFSVWMGASYAFLHSIGYHFPEFHPMHPVNVTLPAPSLTWAAVQLPSASATRLT